MLTIHNSMSFNANANDVAALYANPDYGRTRGTAVGAPDATVTVKGTPAEGFTVNTTMAAPTEKIPEKYRRFVPSGVSVTETQTWAQQDLTHYTGTITMTVSGMPVNLDGTFTLVEVADGCRMDIDGTLKVAIPFVGSQIEKSAEPYISRVFAQEEKNANAALKE